MCFAVLAHMIENAETEQPQKRLMQRSVTRMMDVLGGCERIMDTPIPLTTMRHSARSLMIWLSMFPICLYPTLGPHVLWVTPFAAFLLFGASRLLQLLILWASWHIAEGAGSTQRSMRCPGCVAEI